MRHDRWNLFKLLLHNVSSFCEDVLTRMLRVSIGARCLSKKWKTPQKTKSESVWILKQNKKRVWPSWYTVTCSEIDPAGWADELQSSTTGLRARAELRGPMLGLTKLSNYLTLKGSFSAVSKPNFASKYALESSRRDLQIALLCTVP